jgi:hypothetical protein
MKSILTILLILFVNQSIGQIELQFDNDLTLKVYISKFDPKLHKIDSCKNGQALYYCTIDNAPWFGCDAGLELPKFQLDSLIFSNKNINVSLDVSSMYNPTFSGTIDNRHFEIIKYRDAYEIKGWFSDGAGTYCARWMIMNGKQIRTLLSTNEDECFK